MALEFPRFEEVDMEAAQSYIVDELETYGYDVSFQPITGGTYSSNNIIARLPGTSGSTDIVVVGAHFDSVAEGPGSDDNASGTAGVLETARVLAQIRPTTTIEFVLFGLEEFRSGAGITNGSEDYVADLVTRGVNVIAMLNMEMIGFTCETCQTPFDTVAGCYTITPAAKQPEIG